MGYVCSYCNNGKVNSLPAYCPACGKYLSVLKPEQQLSGYYNCHWCGDKSFKKVPGYCPGCNRYLKGFLPEGVIPLGS